MKLLVILAVLSLPTLAEASDLYARCRNHPWEGSAVRCMRRIDRDNLPPPMPRKILMAPGGELRVKMRALKRAKIERASR